MGNREHQTDDPLTILFNVWPAPAGFLALTSRLDTATETKDKQEEQSASLANSFHHKK